MYFPVKIKKAKRGVSLFCRMNMSI